MTFFPFVSTMHTVGRVRAGTRGLPGTYTSSEQSLFVPDLHYKENFMVNGLRR